LLWYIFQIKHFKSCVINIWGIMHLDTKFLKLEFLDYDNALQNIFFHTASLKCLKFTFPYVWKMKNCVCNVENMFKQWLNTSYLWISLNFSRKCKKGYFVQLWSVIVFRKYIFKSCYNLLIFKYFFMWHLIHSCNSRVQIQSKEPMGLFYKKTNYFIKGLWVLL
jgi:hypothetical protein